MNIKMAMPTLKIVPTLLLCASFLMLLFSLPASNILLILFIGVMVFRYYRDPQFFFSPNRLGWLFILIFFFHVVSFLWTEDTDRYVKFIERNLSWIIFPIVLSDKSQKTIDLELFKKIIFIGLVLFTLINEMAIIIDFFTTTAHEKTVRLFFSRYYQLGNAIRISGIHYPYLSLYCTIAMVFGLSVLKRANNPFWTATGILLLLFYNFQLGSRLFFVINFLLFFYACAIIFFKGNMYLRVFLICFLAGSFWFAKPILAHSYARFVSRLEATFEPRNAPSEFYRPDRWKICLGLIQDNLLLGVGPADIEKELQIKYKENDFKISVLEKYNTHNQYLDYVLRFGVFGGLLLISILALVFVNTYLNKEYDLTVIFLVFAIAMMTENYLSVQRGIVPFCMLSVLFYKKTSKENIT